ncbi:MAG: hypothetical protein GXP19_08385 [Gammaproteobacteria bacterium]|nr:hypothetical protein [Gammaproteobacteria bacterium]
MKHYTNEDKLNQADSNSQPLFTARDTCIGLAACLGVGLLASLMLSAIILLLSANAQAEESTPTYFENISSENTYFENMSIVNSSSDLNSENANNLTIIGYSTPETVIGQKCDASAGQLKNINIGDKLAVQNEGNIQQFFRITGIQIVEELPEVMPVVDESSLLTMITCYSSDNAKLNSAISYLVMIQEITPNQNQMEQRLAHLSHVIE